MYFWTKLRTLAGIGVAVGIASFAAVAYRESWAVAENSAIVAGVMFVVVIAGRLATVRNVRWAAVTEPVPVTVKVRRGRVIVRRVDVWSSIALGIVVVGWAVVIWVRSMDGTAVDMVVSCAFMG